MRTMSGLLVLLGSWCTAQPVLINEVQYLGAARGQVELYNRSTDTIPTSGLRLSTGGRLALLSGTPALAPGGHLVLDCSEHADGRTMQLELPLPLQGGALLLIAEDGCTFIDMFGWRPLRRGASMGRSHDGSSQVSYFAQASMGAPNTTEPAFARALDPPTLVRSTSGEWTATSKDPTAEIRYTLDGSDPSGPAGLKYDGRIAPDGRAVLSVSCVAPGALASTVVRHVEPPAAPVPGLLTIALSATAEDLWSAGTGIDVDGAHSNFSRRGPEWSCAGDLLVENGEPRSVSIRIGGSGSRSLPKRNFVVGADNGLPLSIPGLDPATSFTLRADASPQAFLRGRFIEELVKASGSRVDLQPSVPIELFLNDQDRGLYRAMPTKNANWFSSRTRAGAVDLVSGPSLEVISGSAETLSAALCSLQSGEPIAAIEDRIDINSLLDLACFDLYMGRADHDLNVRCWKSRDPSGRWRWLLYDVDLWSLPDENSVERMAADDNDAAPYVPALLAHPELRDRLALRMTALLNTVLAPANASRLVDELYLAHGSAMTHDHTLWHPHMECPRPAVVHKEMRERALLRPAYLWDALANELRMREVRVEVTVDPPGAGGVYMDGLLLTTGQATLQTLSPLSVRLEARAAEGMELVGWNGNNDGASDHCIVTGGAGLRVSAVFRPAAISRGHGLQQAGE